jgi:hypothetical protein
MFYFFVIFSAPKLHILFDDTPSLPSSLSLRVVRRAERAYGARVNANVAPFDAALPGALPVGLSLTPRVSGWSHMDGTHRPSSIWCLDCKTTE